MLQTVFVDLRNNVLHKNECENKDNSVPNNFTRQCFEILKKAYGEEIFQDKIVLKGVFKILISSVWNNAMEDEKSKLRKFKTALYFLRIIIDQEQDDRYRISCLKIENQNELIVCFNDCVDEKIFEMNTNRNHNPLVVNAEIFKKLHLVSNAIMLNLNNKKDKIKSFKKCGINKIVFSKRFFEEFKDDYKIDVYSCEISFPFVLSKNFNKNNIFARREIVDNPYGFINARIFFCEEFENINYINDLLDFSDNNGWLTFSKVIYDADNFDKYEKIIQFELNFITDVVYMIYSNPKYFISINDWYFILNKWMNHIIFPGFREGIYFLITEHNKEKNNNYVISIMNKNKCERHILTKRDKIKSNKAWFFLSRDFGEIFQQRFQKNYLLDQDLLNYFYKIYQCKKPFCLLHPSTDPAKSYRKDLFFSYKGIFFIRDFYDADFGNKNANVIFNAINEFSNSFSNCEKCKQYHLFSKPISCFEIVLKKSDYTQFIINSFFELPVYFDTTQIPEIPEPSSSQPLEIIQPTKYVKEIKFILFNDLPSQGGKISVQSFDFPIINFEYDIHYKILFNMNFLSFKKQDDYEKTLFSIWYIDELDLINPIFTQTLDDKNPENTFFVSSGRFLKKEFETVNLFYGEYAKFVTWGNCTISKLNISKTIVEESNEVPECVKNFNLNILLNSEMKKCTTHFQLSNLPASSSMTKILPSIRDLEHEIIHRQIKIQSFWFVLQNNIKLSEEILADQRSKNVIYRNVYLPNEKRNFFLKCVITDNFEHPKLPLPAHDFLINQSEIELEKRNKFYFNFIIDPSIDASNLPQTIPTMIYMKYKSNLAILNLKSASDSPISTNGLFGHEMGKITFYSITNYNVETEFFKVVFN